MTQGFTNQNKLGKYLCKFEDECVLEVLIMV